MGLQQGRLERAFEDFELAVKRIERLIDKEMKGEQKRAFKDQFEVTIDEQELIFFKVMVYASRKKEGLF